MGRWIFKSSAVVLGLSLLLVGLVAVGRSAYDQLRTRDQFQIPFADIDCAPPPGMSRADFLGEVQYYAELSDRLPLLDEDLPSQLAAGFECHPRVESVAKVEVTSPRRIHIQLVHRRGVLAVRTVERIRAVDDHVRTVEVIRVVDGHGVVLPRSASPEGLPIYGALVPSPGVPAGKRWGDPAIEAAARTAARRR